MGNETTYPVNWTVRQAEQVDLDQVYGLAKALATSFMPEREAFARSFAGVLANDSAGLWVVDCQGELIGYCLSFDHVAFYANGRVAWVEEIFVKNEWRMAGVGRALMIAVEQWALTRGARLVGLATRRAAAFYQALGYEESAVYYRKVLI